VSDSLAEPSGGTDHDGPEVLVAALTQIPRARRHVARLAAAAGLSADDVERLTVAAHEIITNAIVHGGGRAIVGVESDASRVTVTVADAGIPWVAAIPPDRPDARQLNGRGLWLAEALCDEVIIAAGPEGTTVRLIMYVRPGDAEV
jgi:serine/threonine-protein kinase RsbW